MTGTMLSRSAELDGLTSRISSRLAVVIEKLASSFLMPLDSAVPVTTISSSVLVLALLASVACAAGSSGGGVVTVACDQAICGKHRQPVAVITSWRIAPAD